MDIFKYLSPQRVDELAQEKGDAGAFVKKRASFIFVLVEIDAVEKVNDTLAPVFTAAEKHGLSAMDVCGPLISFAHGHIDFEGNATLDLEAACRDLSAAARNRIRLVCGCEEVLVGNIGSTTRFSYGFVAPNFVGILKALIDSPVGSIVKWPVAKKG